MAKVVCACAGVSSFMLLRVIMFHNSQQAGMKQVQFS